MEDKKVSPAMQIYKQIMWHQGHQMGRSNLRVDHCRDAALSLCVMYGIEFYRDDFLGAYPSEGLYTTACGGYHRENHNKSAALAIEKAWERKPYLLREPNIKTPARVYVGRRFNWFAGLYLTCNGFRDDKKYFNAAWKILVDNSSKDFPHYWKEKTIKTLKITHDDIKLYHKYLDGKLSEKETAELQKKYAFVEKLKAENKLGGE